MGCSRAGAIALVCAILASTLSVLSLLLPYWSKFAIPSPNPDAITKVELVFGIWGSCITVQTAITNSSSTTSVIGDVWNISAATFTCASLHSTDVSSISCEAVPGFIGGKCTRKKMKAELSLCHSDAPMDILLTHTNIDPTSITNWLRFLKKSCGDLGRTTIAMAILVAIGLGFTLVVLLVGVSCAAVDSYLVKTGYVASLFTAVAQSILAVLWSRQANTLDTTKMHYGMSFYLNVSSACVLILASLATKKHLQLEMDADEEFELLMETEDDIKLSSSSENKNPSKSEHIHIDKDDADAIVV